MDEAGGKLEVSQWVGLHLREAVEVSLIVIRVRRFGASGKRRDPLESWLVWAGQSELELSEVWATYKRRFSIEEAIKLNMWNKESPPQAAGYSGVMRLENLELNFQVALPKFFTE